MIYSSLMDAESSALRALLAIWRHATGEVEKMSKTIKEALDWTGEARMAPARKKDSVLSAED